MFRVLFGGLYNDLQKDSLQPKSMKLNTLLNDHGEFLNIIKIENTFEFEKVNPEIAMFFVHKDTKELESFLLDEDSIFFNIKNTLKSDEYFDAKFTLQRLCNARPNASASKFFPAYTAAFHALYVPNQSALASAMPVVVSDPDQSALVSAMPVVVREPDQSALASAMPVDDPKPDQSALASAMLVDDPKSDQSELLEMTPTAPNGSEPTPLHTTAAIPDVAAAASEHDAAYLDDFDFDDVLEDIYSSSRKRRGLTGMPIG